MEGDLKKKKEKKKMEDDLKKTKTKKTDNPPKKRPKQKWKKNQSTKINLIGCDTIENSPSFYMVPTRCILNVGTVPTFNLSHLFL